MTACRVAIAGGGASGTLQALHLLRAGVEDIVMIERAHRPGRGVAYSTQRPEHLLNVPARRMSAYPDDPDHFLRWYAQRGGTAEDFAPRMLYGDYLTQLLEAESGRVEIVRDEAIGSDESGLRLAGGGSVRSEITILAPGNFKPATPRGIDPEALGNLWVDDPWDGEFVSDLGGADTILLLGTGLTAVDAILTLDAAGYRGRIVSVSRRGLAPRGHGVREPTVAPAGPLPSTCVGLLRRVRQRSEEIGWLGAVHELRTITQDIWIGADQVERGRFLRHLRPWWDVHRHKIAPAIFERIEALQQAGKLVIGAAKLVSAEAAGDHALVRLRARGSDIVETFRAARILNCTGPETDIVRSGEKLLSELLGAGRIRPDRCRIGIDVDRECRTIGTDGVPSDSLYAIGPVTRGTFWESVAVPDIRNQTQRVAERIAQI
jgi:uncharacterized NAD(P)/FAD-binding protein YdhS